MLYNESQIRTIINNAVNTAGIQDAKVNGVPVGNISDQTDITRFGAIITQPVVVNEFIGALYNQFIYRATAENYFTSPFDYFRERREGVAYGTYEADVQPIFPVPYDMKAFDRILDFWETPAIVQYFAITRRDTFPQTITKAMLKDAFNSYEAFDNFLAKLILAPRKGNVVIETNAVKMAINQNVASGAVIKKAYTEPQTETAWRELAAEIIGIASGMCAEPSTKYNSYASIAGADGEAWTQSDRRDLVLIGTTDIIAKLRTLVLALSFNKEDVDFNFNFIELNSFNYSTYDAENRAFTDEQTSPIKLIICDGGWIKFEDNLDEELSNTNAMTMGLQRALQIQQTIGLRAYRNAVAYVDADSELVNNTMRVIDENPVKYITSTAEADAVSFKLNGGTVPTGDTVDYTINATKGLLGGEQTAVTLQSVNAYITTYEATPKSLEDAIKAIATGDTKTPSFSVDEGYTISEAADNQYLTVVVTINGSKFTIVVPTFLATGE